MNSSQKLAVMAETIDSQRQAYDELISQWLMVLEKSPLSSRQKHMKSLELHQFAAFIMSATKQGVFHDFQDAVLQEFVEEPDFIVKYKGKVIGLELRRVVNSQAETIGIQKGILRKAEAIFKKTYSGTNILANVSFDDHVNWKDVDPKQLAKEVCDIIYNRHIGLTFALPEYLDSVRTSEHEPLSFNLSGAYWVGQLDLKLIEDAVKEKENKIGAYMNKNSELELFWLLLIISGVSPESNFIMPNQISVELDTKFERVFLLNDFEKKVYAIK